MSAPFATQRDAALALLNSDPRQTRLTRKAGSFLGQSCADPTPLSDAQQGWLDTLLNRAGLPPMMEAAR
jgi:hypothetical protein